MLPGFEIGGSLTAWTAGLVVLVFKQMAAKGTGNTFFNVHMKDV